MMTVVGNPTMARWLWLLNTMSVVSEGYEATNDYLVVRNPYWIKAGGREALSQPCLRLFAVIHLEHPI
ncbi:unnamed protein product [Aspergillus oryzae]|nr:unnamed protein product [Aspergillus oryzae]